MWIYTLGLAENVRLVQGGVVSSSIHELIKHMCHAASKARVMPHEKTSEGLMNFLQHCVIAANRATVWDFLMNMENVARCLGGVQALTQIDENTYEGALRVKVGPVALTFQGTVHIEARDREQWRGRIHAEAKDRKVGGGVRAHLDMHLEEKSPTETAMHVALEAHILGKIGEFGQPVIRKKTETMLQDFATQVSQQLLKP